jgi:hypothetical protein
MAAKPPQRPMPPVALLEIAYCHLQPAPEIGDWLQAHLLAEDGRIHNPAHGHLVGADIGYLWASEGFTKQQRRVIGQAEQVGFQTGGWKRARQEQQLREWFGRVPEFLITLDACFCSDCTDVDFCALVEHEHFHIAQLRNEYGMPRFTKDGAPKLGIRDHDVSEFIGVVERYGAGSPDSAVNRLARAAMARPQLSLASIAASCGTCHLRVA